VPQPETDLYLRRTREVAAY